MKKKTTNQLLEEILNTIHLIYSKIGTNNSAGGYAQPLSYPQGGTGAPPPPTHWHDGQPCYNNPCYWC